MCTCFCVPAYLQMFVHIVCVCAHFSACEGVCMDEESFYLDHFFFFVQLRLGCA